MNKLVKDFAQKNKIDPTPVATNRFRNIVGKTMAPKLVATQLSNGFYRLELIRPEAEPLTIEKARGGVKEWGSMDTLIRWVKENVPNVETFEVKF